MKLLIDIDDCVLDFCNHFRKWLETKKGIISTVDFHTVECITHAIPYAEDEVGDMIIEYQNSYAFSKLPSFKNGIETVIRIQKDYGLDVHAITACNDSEESISWRTKNISDLGLDLKSLNCVGLLKSKADILKTFSPSFWVEDNAKNATVGAELGHTVFLLNSHVNRSLPVHPNVVRVDTWEEIHFRIGLILKGNSALFPVWFSPSSIPSDGTSFVIMHDSLGVSQCRFSQGSWSDSTPISPAEYDGDMWLFGDAHHEIEAEYDPQTGNYFPPTGTVGWLPLSMFPAPTLETPFTFSKKAA